MGWTFLAPLLLGFAMISASMATAAYARWWGGQAAGLVLRSVGILLGIMGLGLAARTPSLALGRWR